MAKKNKIAVAGVIATGRILTNQPGRRTVIQMLSKFGFQANHTPFDLAARMLPPAEEREGKSIMVLFNLELLEVMKEVGQDMGKVLFIADTTVERRFASLVYGVRTRLVGRHSWGRALGHKKQSELLRRLIMGKNSMGEAADITLTNPPYNGGIDLKIINALVDAKMLKRLICVHPSTWLVDMKTQLGPKSGNALFRKFQDAVKGHVTRVDLFNGNPVFGIGLFVPCVITDVDFSSVRTGTIKVTDVGADDYREVLDINDITLHGKDWDPTVKEFLGRVQKFCGTFGSVLDHKKVYSTSNNGNTCIQLAGIRGNVSTNTMTNEDFYTFVQKDSQANKGLRKKDDRMIVLDTGTVAEQDNLLNYLQTDFSRLCLSFLKIKGDLDRGELSLVPWLDFTRSWDDDQLFTMMGYPKGHAIREYAKRFLPDYHGIYTTTSAGGKSITVKTY